jgi:uncharacterized membrane protein
MLSIFLNVMFSWFTAVFFAASFSLYVVHAMQNKDRVLHIALLIVRAFALIAVLVVIVVMIGEKTDMAFWAFALAVGFFVLNLVARVAFYEYRTLTKVPGRTTFKGARYPQKNNSAATSSGHQAPTAPVQ